MDSNRYVRRRPARRGMTLLELILALSLSVVIMMAIGMAIHLHMKTLQSRRMNVEEAQLARQVLRRMADDLRSAVQYQIIDFSSVEKLASGAASSATMGALGGGEGETEGETEDESGLGAALLEGLVDPAAAESEPMSIASTMAPPTIPGLYGNQYELQIDVSHLPRIDEYQVMINPLSGETVADIPSDVKTIAYYLQPDALATATTSTSSDPTAAERARATGAVGRGLVRRELDRAVSLWATTNNNLEDLTTQGEMLAMEVTGLEFRYFDGTEWLTEWNSEERQGLPVAVAIAVEIGGDASSSADDVSGSLLEPTVGTAATGTEAPLTDRLLYRLVVHLPASEPTSAEEARFPESTATEDPAAAGGATSPSAAGGDQGGGGQDQGGAGQGGQQGPGGPAAGGGGQSSGGQAGPGQGGGRGGRGGRGGAAGGGGGQGGGERGGQSGGRGSRGGGGGGQNGGGRGQRGGGR